MSKIKKYHFAFFLFMSFSTVIVSQTKEIDSLKHELTIHTQKDSIRVKILNSLAAQYYRSTPPKSLEYSEKAGKLSDEIHYPEGKARSLYMKGIAQMLQSNFESSIQSLEASSRMYKAIGIKSGIANASNALGIIYNNIGKPKLALECYEKAMQIDTELGIKKNIPNYLYNIGNIYADTGEYEKALINFKKALDEYISSKNQLGILQCWNAIAIVYVEQGNYPLALEYHNNSLATAEKSNDSIGIFQSMNNIGNVYKQQLKFDKALEFYDKALAIKQKNYDPKNVMAIRSNIAAIYMHKKEYNTAISYLESIIKLSKKTGATRQEAICLNNLAIIYLEKEEFLEALRYLKESLTIGIESNLRYEQVESYLGLAKVYYYQNNDKLALFNVTKSAQIAEDLKLIQHQRDIFELMSKIYDRMGNYKKAFYNHKRFKVFNDSLFNKENIEKTTQLEYEYKYKQELDAASIRELTLTKTVKSTSENLEKSQRNLLLGVIGFLVIALLMGAIIFIQKLRNVQTKTQNIIVEQKLLRSQMTPHFIFNSLSVLQGMILNKEEKNSVTYLSKFSKLLRTILENSRHKTVVLSEELSAIDSYMALQNLDVNPPYEFKLIVDSKIDKSALKIPPMLIQPFIENAIEHAFSNKKENKEIILELTFDDKKLVCTIADNGVGINVENQNTNKNKSSLATTITAERLEMLSKEFNTESSVTIENRKEFGEQGTLVTLIIPYKDYKIKSAQAL